MASSLFLGKLPGITLELRIWYGDLNMTQNIRYSFKKIASIFTSSKTT